MTQQAQMTANAFALACAPVVLSACEIAAYEPGHVVPPITVGSDCSFVVPGAVTLNTDITGTAPVNIGGGRIGRRATRGFGCGYDEAIWIIDCNSAEVIGIAGPQSNDMNFSRRAALLYPPEGTLRLSPETTVPDIAAVAAREGYDHWRDIGTHLRETYRASHPEIARTGRPDPACGCRIFYPHSALARQ